MLFVLYSLKLAQWPMWLIPQQWVSARAAFGLLGGVGAAVGTCACVPGARCQPRGSWRRRVGYIYLQLWHVEGWAVSEYCILSTLGFKWMPGVD